MHFGARWGSYGGDRLHHLHNLISSQGEPMMPALASAVPTAFEAITDAAS